MEQFSQAHKKLQLFCADFWPSKEDCQLILDELGISSGRINMAEPAIMRWLSIIRELMRKNDGSMGHLVQVLIKQYPNNRELRSVCETWILAEPAKIMNAPPEKIPVVLPVVVTADFADEAEMVVPRLETLWQSVIDMAKRIRILEELSKAKEEKGC